MEKLGCFPLHDVHVGPYRCSFSIVDLCYLGIFTVTLVIFLLFMYPDMEHPVLVHDGSEIKITLHYIRNSRVYHIPWV